MANPTQTHANHARYVPLFHFVLGGILAANLFLSGKAMLGDLSAERVLAFALAVGLLILFWYARAFALTAQDRVIRFEMRMLLKELLPPALQPRIMDFTTGQLVAMRFASDAELPDLAQVVLRDGITDKKQIKLMIKNWNADHQRV